MPDVILKTSPETTRFGKGRSRDSVKLLFWSLFLKILVDLNPSTAFAGMLHLSSSMG